MYIMLKKRNILAVMIILIATIVTPTLFFTPGIKAVMSTLRQDPITSVSTEEEKVALSINVRKNTDIDYYLDILGETKATFFISEDFEVSNGEKVIEIARLGHDIGLLEDNLKGKTRKEINDRLAQRIERIAFLTKKNCDLVRFDNNSFDSNCVDAVFSLGLYPVQWSTDDTAENFSSGDIILVTGESEINDFIKKTTADGYEITTVDAMILRKNYVIDLGGEQISR